MDDISWESENMMADARAKLADILQCSDVSQLPIFNNSSQKKQDLKPLLPYSADEAEAGGGGRYLPLFLFSNPF